MTSPLEHGTDMGACLYGACPDFTEFDNGKGHAEVENNIEVHYPSDEGAAVLNKCLANAGCFLADVKETA
jgi:hypothetical protein